MTSDRRVNILFQFDDNYAFMGGVAITSLLCNASSDIYYDIYVLTPGYSQENTAKFEELKEMISDKSFSLRFLDASYAAEEVRKWNVPDHRGSYVTYYKLLLNHYFQDTDVERIIHIGADTLVTGDLSGLVDFDFGGAPFAMNISGQNFFERHVPADYDYAIAEMIYFNLPEWRRQHCEERVREHIAQIGEIYGGKDQGILNMEFHDEYAQLPLKYNIYGLTRDFSPQNRRRFIATDKVSDAEVVDAYEHPDIIHIPATFLFRPNIKGSMDPNREDWLYYLDKSPWRGFQLQDTPEMGPSEKIMRWAFRYLPKDIHDYMYIKLRQMNGMRNARKYPPLPIEKRKATKGC